MNKIPRRRFIRSSLLATAALKAWPLLARSSAKSRIIGAMLEWCLDHRLTYLQTIIDSVALPTYLDLTAQTIPLGLPHPYGGGRKTPGGGDCMAIRWPVTQEVLDDIRNYGAPAEADPLLAHVAAAPPPAEFVH